MPDWANASDITVDSRRLPWEVDDDQELKAVRDLGTCAWCRHPSPPLCKYQSTSSLIAEKAADVVSIEP